MRGMDDNERMMRELDESPRLLIISRLCTVRWPRW